MNIFLDAKLRKVVLWNSEFIRKTKQVSFPSDVVGFSASLDLKSGMLIFNKLKMKLS